MCALKVSMEPFATTKDLTPDTVLSLEEKVGA
jgi:hypothetical protein